MSDLLIEFSELYAYYISPSFKVEIMNYKVETLIRSYKLSTDDFNGLYRDWYVVSKEQGDI